MARISENWSEQHAASLKIHWCINSTLQPALTSVGRRLITRDRGNCVINCRFVRWLLERSQHSSMVQILEEPWALSYCFEENSFRFLLLTKHKKCSIPGQYKSEYSKVTSSHPFANSERKEVYDYHSNHDDRNNKPCITCLDGHCDILCDEKLLSSESRWMQPSHIPWCWDKSYRTENGANWRGT